VAPIQIEEHSEAYESCHTSCLTNDNAIAAVKYFRLTLFRMGKAMSHFIRHGKLLGPYRIA